VSPLALLLYRCGTSYQCITLFHLLPLAKIISLLKSVSLASIAYDSKGRRRCNHFLTVEPFTALLLTVCMVYTEACKFHWVDGTWLIGVDEFELKGPVKWEWSLSHYHGALDYYTCYIFSM
jgi:hypothetical protein